MALSAAGVVPVISVATATDAAAAGSADASPVSAAAAQSLVCPVGHEAVGVFEECPNPWSQWSQWPQWSQWSQWPQFCNPLCDPVFVDRAEPKIESLADILRNS